MIYPFLAELIQPATLSIVLTLLALVQVWRRSQERRGLLWLITVPFVALIVTCWPPVAFLSIGSLEWQYAPNPHRPDLAQAIVVLGGYVRPPSKLDSRAVLGWDSYTRCLHAVDLYMQGPPCPIVVTGGKVNPTQPGPTIAEAMCEFLVTQGIPRQEIWVENESRTTYENAVMTRALLHARKINHVVVVTDAVHVPRAEKCFRAQDLDVFMSGCNYGANEFEWSARSLLPKVHAAGDVQRAIHEWLGILYYRLRGRS